MAEVVPPILTAERVDLLRARVDTEQGIHTAREVILTLAASHEALRAECDRLDEECGEKMSENLRLTAEVEAAYQAGYERGMRHVDAAEAENLRLREALREFFDEWANGKTYGVGGSAVARLRERVEAIGRG